VYSARFGNFIFHLLNKVPRGRPTAVEALSEIPSFVMKENKSLCMSPSALKEGQGKPILRAKSSANVVMTGGNTQNFLSKDTKVNISSKNPLLIQENEQKARPQTAGRHIKPKLQKNITERPSSGYNVRIKDLITPAVKNETPEKT